MQLEFSQLIGSLIGAGTGGLPSASAVADRPQQDLSRQSVWDGQLGLFERPVAHNTARISANRAMREALEQTLFKIGQVPAAADEVVSFTRQYLNTMRHAFAQEIDCECIGRKAGFYGAEAVLFGRALSALELNRDYPPGFDVRGDIARFLSFGVKSGRLSREETEPTYFRLLPRPQEAPAEAAAAVRPCVTQLSPRLKELLEFTVREVLAPSVNGALVERVDQIIGELGRGSAKPAERRERIGRIAMPHANVSLWRVAGYVLEDVFSGALRSSCDIRRDWAELSRTDD